MIIINEIMKGKIKCNVKNRFNVTLSIENPPQIHCTMSVPKYGIADNKLVITLAPQKDIWPQGKIYPKKAVIIDKKKIIIPIIQV